MENQEKKLCLSLVHADSEEEVVELLRASDLWDSKSNWRYYGDKENSFGIVGNQASSADAALVEKLINSIDARLTNESLLRGINPEGPDAPQSIREAVARFFDNGRVGGTAGLISEWSDSKRTEVARGITLSSTGSAPDSGNPCLVISDSGEGQLPDKFPETFLSLSESNKLRVPFVQGKFNQGGTGALQFCGKRNFQLIVSKRNPKLVDKNRHNPSDSHWAFTIVRREDPEEGRRNSIFTYLAPIGAEESPRRGSVLHFAAEELEIFPEGHKAYAVASEYGTLIKLYEYNLKGFRTNILRRGGLLARLDILLPNPALPIRLHECRSSYKGHEGSFDTTLSGIQVRLDNDRQGNIEDGFPTTSTLKVAGEQLTARIYAFKKGKADTYRRNEGIIFTVNGQTHGSLTSDFFRRERVGLSYLSDSLLAIVDCSNFKTRNREDLFPTSRDRMRKNDFRDELESALEEMVKHNQLLRELKERRRRERMDAQLDNAKPLEDILSTIINRYPTLSALFLEGKRISSPFKTIQARAEEKEYKGKAYPTYFKFKGKEYGTDLQRECHINMRSRITFETDATNDYFDRSIDPGTCNVHVIHGEDRFLADDYSMNLQNGIATLSLKLPVGTAVGEVVQGACLVNDGTRLEPFENSFRISVRESIEPSGVRSPRRKPPSEEEGDDRETPAGLEMPHMTDVLEADWERQTPPFDKYTALTVVNAGSAESDETEAAKSTYDFYINIDNIFLRTELKNGTSKEEPEVVKARFRYGLVLIGLGILQGELGNGARRNTPKKPIKEQERENDDSDEESVEDKVAAITKAIAPILLPMITSLGSIDIEDVKEDYSAERG